MANDVQILDKIQRNCEQIGISVSRTDADTLVAAGFTVTYEAADIQSPMGGVSDASAPFLGIGIANPGVIKMDLGGALSTLTGDDLRALRVASGHANDIKVVNGGTELVRLEGHVDLLGMGQ